MSTVQQNPKVSQRPASAVPSAPGKTDQRLIDPENLILNLQSTVGNRAVQRLLVSMPGDVHEREADRVAEQVTREPGPQLRRTCSCGGECSACNAKRPGREPESMRAKHVEAGGTERVAALPNTHEIFRYSGQTPGSNTNSFTESFPGSDFSPVGVQTDGAPERYARDPDAPARTAGSEIEFGPGRSAPGMHGSRRSIVHELTHAAERPGIDTEGDKAVTGMIRNTPGRSGSRAVQAKLAVSQPGDALEQEADHVADDVMRMPRSGVSDRSPAVASSMRVPQVQRMCSGCDEEEKKKKAGVKIQRKVQAGSGSRVTAGVAANINGLRGGGRQLPTATRAFFESRFGEDFGAVRVHTDERAHAAARSIHAKAFTYGHDIVFAKGHYSPNSSEGQHLLAHELAHVVQQEGGDRALMRTALPFDSTIEMRHRVLKGQTKFEVTTGAIAVTADARWHTRDEEGDEERRQEVPSEKVCGTSTYGITVSQEGRLWDSDYGTCYFPSNGPGRAVWNKLPEDTYYLTIWSDDHNPHCVLEGQVRVESMSNVEGKTCTELPPGPKQMLHDALAAAGMIPALGAFPDLINAGFYAIEGEWTEAGLSVAVALPFLGDSFQAVRQGEKMVIKVAGKDVERLGAQKIAHALEQAKAETKVAEAAQGAHGAEEAAKASKTVEKEAANAEKGTAKELAESELKKKIAECEAIWAGYKALKCPSCNPNDTPAVRAAKIACLTALLEGRRRYLKERCDYVLPGSIARGSAKAEAGHQTQVDQVVKMLAKCATLPTK